MRTLVAIVRPNPRAGGVTPWGGAEVDYFRETFNSGDGDAELSDAVSKVIEIMKRRNYIEVSVMFR